MEIQRLKSEVIANIRSSSTINNVVQCVTELVLNSLDSKSTSIAVRVNLVTFKIQVVDNGEGITKKNLELVGIRYMTNKCDDLTHLENHIKYHGFRGEALASIINISKKVTITSKHINSTETYAKTFGKYTDNQITTVKNRPSFGTTVTVEGFLNNLPIRRNRIVPELELEDVKRSIESLIIMYPDVSFSVRNDLSGNLIINSQKNKDIISSFKCLHPEIDEELSLMKVSKDKVTVEALLFKGLFANKHLQYVYVNKRPVHCPKIQKFVSNVFIKNKDFNKKKSLNSKIVNDNDKHPIYVINIKCPHSHVDILLNPAKTLVEFKNWTIILKCLEKLVYSFFGNGNRLGAKDEYLTREEIKSGGGVSQIYGAFKSYGYKRKQPEKDSQAKMQKLCSHNSNIIDESDFVVDTVKARSDFIQEDPIVAENFISHKKFNKHKKCRKKNEIQNKMSIEINQDCISQKLKILPTDETEQNIGKSVSDVDIYSINDITPAKKTKAKVFKKPLPIKIKKNSVNLQNLQGSSKLIAKYHTSMHVSPDMDENINRNVDKEIPAIKNAPNKPTLTQIAPNKLEDEKSTLSKFTADENKGKNLIMDMFLKSTQVYSTEEDNQSEARSDETILEVESNFLLENNIQTKINGLSKTMSMSVNIRSTKRIKKQKFKANRTRKADRTSKCIQTTLEENKMVSKFVQTTMDQGFLKTNSKLRCDDLNNIFINKKPADAENYTVVLSDSVHPKETPRFRFIYQKPSYFNSEPINKFTSFSNNCKCNCHLNASKIFHFVGSVYKNTKQATDNILNDNIDIFGSVCDLNETDISSIEKFHVDGETENYDGIKRKAGNLMQAETNRFAQNFNQLKQQHLNNVPYRNQQPVKLREEGKMENYECNKARNPTQAEVKKFVQNYDQHKQQQYLNNILYRNYEPVEFHEDAKTENYKDIKHTAINSMQAEVNRLTQNYGNHKQHLNNILYRHFEPVVRTIPNIIQNPYQEAFMMRQKRTNKSPQGMFDFHRSPYFVPPGNTLYPKTNFNLTPYTVKDFRNIAPNNTDSYVLFDPQYRSTQLKDFNKDTYLNLKNCVGRGNDQDQDFPHMMPNNADSYVLFDPQYQSTQSKDFKKDSYLHFKDCVGRGTHQDRVRNMIPNNTDPYVLFDPQYQSTQSKDFKKDNYLHFNDCVDGSTGQHEDFRNMVLNNAESHVLFDPQYRNTKLKDFNNVNYLNSKNCVGGSTDQNRNFRNIVPNNADSYALFDPQYRSTQSKDFNEESYQNLKNRVDQNQDFHNMVPNDADSHVSFDPQYRSTQLRDFNKDNCLHLKNCVVDQDQDFRNIAPNNAPDVLFDPQYRSTQLKDFNMNNCLNLENCVDRGKDRVQIENFSETDFTIDQFDNFQPVYKSTQDDRIKCASVGSLQQQNYIHTPFAECNQSSLNSQLNLINACESLNPFDNIMTNVTNNMQSVSKKPSNSDEKMEYLESKMKVPCKTFVFGEFNKQNNSDPHIDLDIACQATQGNISPENVEINHLPSGQKQATKEHSDAQSELIITLSDQERQELLRRELNAERDLDAKKCLEWDNRSAAPRLQEDTRPSDYHEFGKEWIKRKNNFGSSFYINKRTGFTTFFTPKPNGNQFEFGRRFEFMPKGSSPILKDVKQVDGSLNQNDKEKLQGYILESHQNELLIIKWQNYIKHNDPKSFFDEVYKERVKLFEDCLPKINAFDKKKYVSELDGIMHFNKTLFNRIDVIGQVDGKFIAVVEKTKNLLIVFDQHAVHERIRLEELLKVYTNAKMKCMEKLIFFIPQNDLSLLKKHELYLNTLGLSVEFFVNGINILEVPLCIYNKFKDNDQSSLIEVIQLLINEIIELLKETRSVSFGNLPKIIQNVINLEACRGAIKFGDILSKKNCIDLLGRLAVCKLPFQCAHGRPTLTPLVRLNLTQKCVPYKVNLKKTIGVLDV